MTDKEVKMVHAKAVTDNKTTEAEIMEYAQATSFTSACDLLLLCGNDFDGDYDATMAKLKDGREREWAQSGALKITANDRTWWAFPDPTGEAVNLFDEDGDMVGGFCDLGELMYFVEGVK